MVKVIVTRPGYIFGRVQKVGAELRIKSTGEFSHRWMEPADEASRAALKSATNGNQTWARHQWAQIATPERIFWRTLPCMGLTQCRVSRSC